MFTLNTCGAHIPRNRTFPDPASVIPDQNGNLNGYVDRLLYYTGGVGSDGSQTLSSLTSFIADDLLCGGVSTRVFIRTNGQIRFIRGNGTNFYTFDVFVNNYQWIDIANLSTYMNAGGTLDAYPTIFLPVKNNVAGEFGINLDSSALPPTSTTIKYTLADAIWGSTYAPNGNVIFTLLESTPPSGATQYEILLSFYRLLPSSQFLKTVSLYLAPITNGISKKYYVNNSGFWDNDGQWVIGTNWTATWNYTHANGYVQSTGIGAIGALYYPLAQIVGQYCGDSTTVTSWGYTFNLLAVPGGGLRCRVGMRKVTDGTWVYGAWHSTTGRKYETFARTAGGFDRISIETEGAGFQITGVQAIGEY